MGTLKMHIPLFSQLFVCLFVVLVWFGFSFVKSKMPGTVPEFRIE